jgi:uncharacterized RDD family membrane protein YckC
MRYSKEHCWVEKTENGVRIGITDFLRSRICKNFVINLCDEDDIIRAGEIMGDVESCDWFDIIAPVSGRVLCVNDDLLANPQILLEFARLYHQSIVKLMFIFYFVQTVYFTFVPAIIGCGQTVGKLLAGIGVVDAMTLNELKPIKLIFREFVCRTLLETVLIIPLIISIGLSFFRDDSKSLHDILSKSVVIKMDMYNVE